MKIVVRGTSGGADVMPLISPMPRCKGEVSWCAHAGWGWSLVACIKQAKYCKALQQDLQGCGEQNEGAGGVAQTGGKADNTKVGDYLVIKAAWWPESGIARLAGPVGAHPGPVWAMAPLGQRAGLP